MYFKKKLASKSRQPVKPRLVTFFYNFSMRRKIILTIASAYSETEAMGLCFKGSIIANSAPSPGSELSQM